MAEVELCGDSTPRRDGEMGLRETIIKVEGKAANIERKLLLTKMTRCFLLKRAKESKRLVSITELVSEWNARYSDYRQQLGIDIFTDAPEFADMIAQASFVAYGETSGPLLEYDVFSIDPERRDVIPPTGGNPAWKLWVTRNPQERFSEA